MGDNTRLGIIGKQRLGGWARGPHQPKRRLRARRAHAYMQPQRRTGPLKAEAGTKKPIDPAMAETGPIGPMSSNSTKEPNDKPLVCSVNHTSPLAGLRVRL